MAQTSPRHPRPQWGIKLIFLAPLVGWGIFEEGARYAKEKHLDHGHSWMSSCLSLASGGRRGDACQPPYLPARRIRSVVPHTSRQKRRGPRMLWRGLSRRAASLGKGILLFNPFRNPQRDGGMTQKCLLKRPVGARRVRCRACAPLDKQESGGRNTSAAQPQPQCL
jgi:hypothetical protein